MRDASGDAASASPLEIFWWKALPGGQRPSWGAGLFRVFGAGAHLREHPRPAEVLAAIRNAVNRDARASWYFSLVFPDARATTPEKPRQDLSLPGGGRAGKSGPFRILFAFYLDELRLRRDPDSRRVRGNPREGSSPTGAISVAREPCFLGHHLRTSKYNGGVGKRFGHIGSLGLVGVQRR